MEQHPLLSVDPLHCRHRDVDAGTVLFRQGQPAHHVYLSKSATVHLCRTGPQGERIIIFRATSGQSFAEASIFSQHYHCDAEVVLAGRIITINKQTVLNRFADSEFAKGYNRHMARQVQTYRQRLEIMAIKSARERVLAGLIAGLLDGKVMDFAAQIGLTHEATYRALRQLVETGSVSNPARGVYRLVSV